MRSYLRIMKRNWRPSRRKRMRLLRRPERPRYKLRGAREQSSGHGWERRYGWDIYICIMRSSHTSS
jgi:26S proteasome regulatory subunit N7